MKTTKIKLESGRIVYTEITRDKTKQICSDFEIILTEIDKRLKNSSKGKYLKTNGYNYHLKTKRVSICKELKPYIIGDFYNGTKWKQEIFSEKELIKILTTPTYNGKYNIEAIFEDRKLA